MLSGCESKTDLYVLFPVEPSKASAVRTCKRPSLFLVLFALGEHYTQSNNVGHELGKERGLLERVDLVVDDLFVRGQARDEHGVRVSQVKVADQ